MSETPSRRLPNTPTFNAAAIEQGCARSRSAYGHSYHRGRGGRRGAFPSRRGNHHRKTYDRPFHERTPVTQKISNEIIGHSDQANQSAANIFKPLLADDRHPSPPASSANPDHPWLAPFASEIEQARGEQTAQSQHLSRELLSEAFQREYAPKRMCRAMSHSGGPDQEVPLKDQQNHVLISQRPLPHTFSMPFATRSAKEASLLAHTDNSLREVPPPRLRLYGLGEGRARNEFGRSLAGGQELGIGVIGGSLPVANDTQSTFIVSENGCDIPMIRETWNSGTRKAKTEPQEARIAMGSHLVSLDPNLPPLAIEHPARVWNSMIHSLGAELQPIIKWDYEQVESPEEGRLWVARLTLVLPPTHPTIDEHPLFRTLPKNRYKREYVSAVEALGGVKTWAGDAKKLKADAQNSALVKCIAEDALGWVHAPDGLNAIPDSDDEDEDVDHRHLPIPGDACSQALGPVHPQKLKTEPVGSALEADKRLTDPHQDQYDAGEALDQPSTTKENTEEIKIEDTDLDLGSESSGTTRSRVLTPWSQVPNTSASTRVDIDHSPMQRLLAAVNKTLGPNGLDVHNPISLTTGWDPLGGKYQCTLSVGTGEDIKTYQEDSIHESPEAAQDSVCKRALDLNVEGFLGWLQQSLAPPLPEVLSEYGRASTSKISPLELGSLSASTAFGHKVEYDDQKIDWQQQLADFCEESGLPHPKYSQRVEHQSDGQVLFYAQVAIEDETYPSSRGFASIREARQYTARFVFSENFGQTPKHL